jgi:hypothetical protein
MNLEELLANPNRLIALLCIIGFVLAINLPLLFPVGLGKLFEREAKVWGKALRGGSDVAEKNKAQIDELHRQVEALKSDGDEKQETK